MSLATGVALLLVSALRGASATATILPRCTNDDWSLETMYWRSRGEIVIAVGITTGEINQCVLSGTVKVVVDDSKGKAIAAVRKNPRRWRISSVLVPWDDVVHVWAWRNWCRPRHPFFLGASLGGQHRVSSIVGKPLCRDRHVRSSLVDSGSGTASLPFTGDRIPAHVLSSDIPPPISPSLLRNPTGWLVSDGRTLVAVYAGEAGEDPSIGRFVIIRQNLVFGMQDRRWIDAGRIGALQITNAPEGTEVETSAQRGDIEFSSTSGATGVFHLSDDTIELTGGAPGA
jgi:hypothetical protein